MKIIVVGAGKVGYSVAQRLVQDEHDVYVIEQSPERIKNLENSLDVSLVQGNGSSLPLLREIGMDAWGSREIAPASRLISWRMVTGTVTVVLPCCSVTVLAVPLV